MIPTLPAESPAGSSARSQHPSWMLKRNCALPPAQFGVLLGIVAATTFGVAAVCVLVGAWYVMVFALIEILALAIACVVYARHAGDFERITLTPDDVIVERCEAGVITEHRTAARLLNVRYPWLVDRHASGRVAGVGRWIPGRAGLIALVPQGIGELRLSRQDLQCVGRHLLPTERARLASEIREALRRIQREPVRKDFGTA